MLAVMYERLPLPTASPAYDMPLLAGSRLKEGPTSGAPWQTCHCGGAPVGVVPGGPVVPIVGVPSNDGLRMQSADVCGGVDPLSSGPLPVPESTSGVVDPASHGTTVMIAPAVASTSLGNVVTSTEY